MDLQAYSSSRSEISEIFQILKISEIIRKSVSGRESKIIRHLEIQQADKKLLCLYLLPDISEIILEYLFTCYWGFHCNNPLMCFYDHPKILADQCPTEKEHGKCYRWGCPNKHKQTKAKYKVRCLNDQECKTNKCLYWHSHPMCSNETEILKCPMVGCPNSHIHPKPKKEVMCGFGKHCNNRKCKFFHS